MSNIKRFEPTLQQILDFAQRQLLFEDPKTPEEAAHRDRMEAYFIGVAESNRDEKLADSPPDPILTIH